MRGNDFVHRALQRTGGEQEGVGRADAQRRAGERELDLFGMSQIEDTARRYEVREWKECLDLP